MQSQRRVSFSFLLPLLDMIVWVLLVALPASLVFLNLEQMAQGSNVANIHIGDFSVSIPRNQFVSHALWEATTQSSHAIVVANVPGFFGDSLVSLMRWRHTSMTLDSWRAVSFPLFCLPAWWLVGLGIDVLLKWRHLHWATFLTGTVLFVLFSVLFVGFRFALSPSDFGEDVYLLWGIGLWVGLFAVLPVAWVRQWRLSRLNDR
jgi:hypothetical protein